MHIRFPIASMFLLIALPMVLCCPNVRAADEVAIKSGQKLAFLGDSITQFGNDRPSGYVKLVISGLKANDIDVTPIPAGISGHTSRDMIARINRDVIEKKPDWMTLSCGVNDVWHGANGVDLPTYKKNITEMVDRAQKAGIKVMLLTSTMIGEDQSNLNNRKLIPYNDFLRDLAKEKGCLLADLNADMHAAVIAADGGKAGSINTLTVDGVHMNPTGNVMMATGILRAFGLDDVQLQKAKEAWLDIPEAVEASARKMITLRQWDQLNAIASSKHKTVADMLNEAFGKTVDAMTADAGGSGK
jgi:lysophospholipase L1-like esterase